MLDSDTVIIIGAGLAGLCCASNLHKEGIPFLLLEASDAVGGRIRTDSLDGFLLDRGFQILLSSYPEATAVLDYNALDLKPFFPGALLRSNGKFHTVADPFRSPLRAVETLLAPVGTVGDKLRVAGLRTRQLTAQQALKQDPETTMELLKKTGFSDNMIQQFFRPFLGGIFLDQSLETNSKMFDFVFSMLASGDNALPSRGMQAIPEQIASRLPQECIRLNTAASSVAAGRVLLESGELLRGRSIVVATEEPRRNNLMRAQAKTSYKSQTCVYFAADNAPFEEPMLVLNGDKHGIVSNLTVPSNVSPSYAPDGKALISAVLIGDAPMDDSALSKAILEQMSDWYGQEALKWQHLRTYRIKYALPDQSPQAVSSAAKNYKGQDGVFFCGDYMENASINGAMVSGRKAAEAVLQEIKSALAHR